MDVILKYFSDLSPLQVRQFESLYDLYLDWNMKINVISRKDIGNLYVHHVLHSLSLCEIVRFTDGSKLLDLGCGGGFPGIPLAIMYPRCDFHLVDSVGKKLTVCDGIISSLGLKNVHTSHCRGESLSGRNYDFVLSRAAMSFSSLVDCSRGLILREQHNSLPNGILALKGGDLSSELAGYTTQVRTWDISTFYSEDYFKEKKIIHISL